MDLNPGRAVVIFFDSLVQELHIKVISALLFGPGTVRRQTVNHIIRRRRRPGDKQEKRKIGIPVEIIRFQSDKNIPPSGIKGIFIGKIVIIGSAGKIPYKILTREIRNTLVIRIYIGCIIGFRKTLEGAGRNYRPFVRFVEIRIDGERQPGRFGQPTEFITIDRLIRGRQIGGNDPAFIMPAGPVKSAVSSKLALK